MSRLEHGKDLDRAAMERMTTAALEELLLQDFHDPERGEGDMSGPYQAAQVLADRTPQAPGAVDRAWREFREGYLPFSEALREDGGTPSSDAAPERRHPALRRWGTRAALAAAAAVMLLSICIAATADGRDLRDLLALWTDEQIWLTPGQVAPADRDDIHMPEEPGEYVSIQEALAECGLTEPVAPRQLPEGFEMDELIVDECGPSELIVHAHYSRGGDNLIVDVSIYLDQEGAGGGRTSFQKDEGDPVPYEAGGVTHLLATNAGRPIAVWANGPAECAVSGDITMEELEQMIDSIYR